MDGKAAANLVATIVTSIGLGVGGSYSISSVRNDIQTLREDGVKSRTETTNTNKVIADLASELRAVGERTRQLEIEFAKRK